MWGMGRWGHSWRRRLGYIEKGFELEGMGPIKGLRQESDVCFAY